MSRLASLTRLSSESFLLQRLKITYKSLKSQLWALESTLAEVSRERKLVVLKLESTRLHQEKLNFKREELAKRVDLTPEQEELKNVHSSLLRKELDLKEQKYREKLGFYDRGRAVLEESIEEFRREKAVLKEEIWDLVEPRGRTRWRRGEGEAYVRGPPLREIKGNKQGDLN